jgi:carbamate kinase
MGPKVEAACAFARQSGGTASIGDLGALTEVLAGSAGTHVATSYEGIAFA